MKIKSKEEVIQQLQSNKDKIKDFGVKEIGFFGSFTKGDIREESDLDVLVIFETEQKTFRNFMDLSFFLEDLFERQVDLLTPEALSPYFGSRILREVQYVPLS